MTRNEAKRIRANIEKTATFADDKTALESVWMYPAWKPGMVCEVGKRVVYDGKLYRIGATHTAQSDRAPDVAATLFVRVDETHAGTAGDPIPYDGNMVLVSGLYYTQSGVTYICTRDSGAAVYHPLKELVGLYVEIVGDGG